MILSNLHKLLTALVVVTILTNVIIQLSMHPFNLFLFQSVVIRFFPSGQSTSPYPPESLLVALEKLNGSYDSLRIAR